MIRITIGATMRCGAHPDQLDLLARSLDEGAVQLERSIAELVSFARRATWTGSDRERLLASVAEAERGPGALAVSQLRSLATGVGRQADDQRLASADDVHAADTSRVPATDHSPAAPPAPPVLSAVSGDLATATSVVVLVPGVGSNAGNFGRLVDDARALARATGTDRGAVAVIAWLGYDAPGGFDEPERLAEALSSDRAAEGAASLRQSLDTLGIPAGAELTLVGHSYGSLVVVGAARHNPEVDQIVVLGSPGLGVDHLADLDLPPTTRFLAMSTPGDPVSHSQWFGLDPTLPAFGGRTLDGDPWPGTPAVDLRHAHSSYYDEGSQTLDNLALVVTGRQFRLEPRSRIAWADAPLRATDLPFARPVWGVIDLLADELRT